MNKPKVWINGKFIDMVDARISIFDRGFLYGDGVFETMRSYAGVIFKLEEHLERLFGALGLLKIKAPHSKKYLTDAIYENLTVNGLKSANIRVSVTRGEGILGIGYRDEFVPNTVIVAKELKEYPDWMYLKGISAKVVDVRQNEHSPVPKIKSLNFLNYILARQSAKEKGFDEAILMNTTNYIAEASTSNVFSVNRGRIVTPSLNSGVLPGITRGAIIKIAKRMRLDIEEDKVPYVELLDADEIFLTNSLVEILPVTKLDSKKVGKGIPGEITKLLHISYQKEVIKETLRLRQDTYLR